MTNSKKIVMFTDDNGKYLYSEVFLDPDNLQHPLPWWNGGSYKTQEQYLAEKKKNESRT